MHHEPRVRGPWTPSWRRLARKSGVVFTASALCFVVVACGGSSSSSSDSASSTSSSSSPSTAASTSSSASSMNADQIASSVFSTTVCGPKDPAVVAKIPGSVSGFTGYVSAPGNWLTVPASSPLKGKSVDWTAMGLSLPFFLAAEQHWQQFASKLGFNLKVFDGKFLAGPSSRMWMTSPPPSLMRSPLRRLTATPRYRRSRRCSRAAQSWSLITSSLERCWLRECSRMTTRAPRSRAATPAPTGTPTRHSKAGRPISVSSTCRRCRRRWIARMGS